MRKDNPEIKEMILTKLAEVEYTHTYAIAFRDHKIVKAAIIEDADAILPLITVAERQSASHGGDWGVRVNLTKEKTEIVKAYAREIIDICSVAKFENEYETNGHRGSNNRGHIFEQVFADVTGGKRNDNPTAKCTECGDVVVNGEHIQCKLWNATITTESQVNRFYARKCA